MGKLTIWTIACVVLALPPALRAATFTVDSSDDEVDAVPGDGRCATAKRACTLRAAILEANARPGADTIILPAGRYPLLIRGTDEDAGFKGDLDITDDLAITGAGEAASSISGSRIDRVFDVHSPAHVTLSGMTIMLGQAPPDDEKFGDGGGMFNDATVTLNHVTFFRNRGFAGGFENSGTATLTHVTFRHNQAYDGSKFTDGPGDAGGMSNDGTAVLTDVMFHGNRAGDGLIETAEDAGVAGGMLNAGDATLTNVTFSLNRAGRSAADNDGNALGGDGGGFVNYGTAMLNQVTFDRNRAGHGAGLGGNGGGMHNNGTTTLTDVSFVGNHAGNAGGGYRFGVGEADGGGGGGMWNDGTVTLINVAFDRNRAGNGRLGLGGDGGALLSGCSANRDCGPVGTTTLINVTMTRNLAGNGEGHYYLNYESVHGSPYVMGGNGGGLSAESATLTNVTLALNHAGVNSYHGKLIRNGEGNQLVGAATLTNTIVFGPGMSCAGFLPDPISQGHNLDSGTTCGFIAPGDLSNTDPRLERLSRNVPLTNNGGFTPTLALQPGSPAIDAGDPAACPATDQRGVARPQGAACDIGAYEFQP